MPKGGKYYRIKTSVGRKEVGSALCMLQIKWFGPCKDHELLFTGKKSVWLGGRVKRDGIRGVRKLRLLF